VARIRGRTAAARLAGVLAKPLTTPPGIHVEYSNRLRGAVRGRRARGERAAAEVPEAARVQPLGDDVNQFRPGLALRALRRRRKRCARVNHIAASRRTRSPTRSAFNRQRWIVSTAGERGRFAAMIANGGEAEWRADSALRSSRHARRPGAGRGPSTLGWEAFCPDEHLTEQQPCQKPVAFGHTGWTGTSFWTIR